MNWKPETWNAIIRALRQGSGVVPVIGPELQRVPDPDRPGKHISFVRLLARRLHDKLSVAEQSDLPAEPSLHQLALAPTFRGRRRRFAEELSCIQNELLPAAEEAIFPANEQPGDEKHPLRLLAEITAFPLYLTTTPDDLLHRILSRARALLDEDVRGFQLAHEAQTRHVLNDHRSTLAWDLPPSWDASATARPFLYHLFGRLNDPDGEARFDVTEEDHFEMLCRLQSEEWRPEQLCRELRRSHVLLLGQPLAEWDARFFLRLLRGDRLSGLTEYAPTTTEGIVDWLFSPGPPPAHYEDLATFLDNFSDSSRIYREAAPEAFVRELHKRWIITQTSSGTSSTSKLPSAPANLARDGVFISYCKEDLVPAERLAAKLRAAGVKTFLDSTRNDDSTQPGLEHGCDFARTLQNNVRSAIVFIPLLSAHTKRRGWFRREWIWACECDDEWFGFADRGYLRPVIVDGSAMSAISSYMPEKFQSAHCVSLPGGETNEAFISSIVAAVQHWGGHAPSA